MDTKGLPSLQFQITSFDALQVLIQPLPNHEVALADHRHPCGQRYQFLNISTKTLENNLFEKDRSYKEKNNNFVKF